MTHHHEWSIPPSRSPCTRFRTRQCEQIQRQTTETRRGAPRHTAELRVNHLANEHQVDYVLLVNDASPPSIGEIIVVWLDLDLAPEEADSLRAFLNPIEERRVAGIISPRDRRRAAVRLVRRRQVIADMLDLHPRDVVLGAGENGRPCVVSPENAHLEFSASQCGDLSLLAISSDLRIGVDVESHDDLMDYARLLTWITTPDVVERVSQLSDTEQREATLRLWTRKEAYLKATGQGIGSDLADVQLPLDSAPGWQEYQAGPGATRWLLHDLPGPRPELIATVVVNSHFHGEPPPGIRVLHR